jgi:hypothetical protein
MPAAACSKPAPKTKLKANKESTFIGTDRFEEALVNESTLDVVRVDRWCEAWTFTTLL